MLTFRSPDGIDWRVEVRSPGSSNAAVVFHHPASARQNRYGWYIARGPEARSVTTRLDPESVLKSLAPRDLARIFRQSHAIEAPATPYNLQVTRSV